MAGERRERHRRAARSASSRGALTGWAVFVYFFLFAPIILLVLFSFNANQYGTLPITGWTTHWYSQAFNDFQIQDAVKTTLSVALEVTILSARSSGPPRRSRSCARTCRSGAGSAPR